jgi:hypothetical protein
MDVEAPKCIICGNQVEAWPGGGGYGHNPDPVAMRFNKDGSAKACNWCNEHVVIPVRLRAVQARMSVADGKHRQTGIE